MDFAPYQSSPPENNRPWSPGHSNVASPRASLDNNRPQQQRAGGGFASPPPLQHPQPQRNWQSALPSGVGGGLGGYASEAGVGVGAGAGAAGGGAYVSEFDTSLGIRLDYEACLAYVGLPPLGAIILLILERKSDFVR